MPCLQSFLQRNSLVQIDKIDKSSVKCTASPEGVLYCHLHIFLSSFPLKLTPIVVQYNENKAPLLDVNEMDVGLRGWVPTPGTPGHFTKRYTVTSCISSQAFTSPTLTPLTRGSRGPGPPSLLRPHHTGQKIAKNLPRPSRTQGYPLPPPPKTQPQTAT